VVSSPSFSSGVTVVYPASFWSSVEEGIEGVDSEESPPNSVDTLMSVADSSTVVAVVSPIVCSVAEEV